MSEWGWNPESFAAIGTVSAALIGALALVVASIQVSITSSEKRANDRRMQRQQAEGVFVRYLSDSALPDNYPPDSDIPPSGDCNIDIYDGALPPESRLLIIEVQNSSDGPIELTGLVINSEWPFSIPLLDVKPMAAAVRESWFEPRWTHLVVFNSKPLPPGRVRVKLPLKDNIHIPLGNRFGVMFKDARGLRWTRWFGGNLTRGVIDMGGNKVT